MSEHWVFQIRIPSVVCFPSVYLGPTSHLKTPDRARPSSIHGAALVCFHFLLRLTEEEASDAFSCCNSRLSKVAECRDAAASRALRLKPSVIHTAYFAALPMVDILL